MTTVLQPWVCELPMMMQSVLLGAIRGPDGHPKYNPAKLLLRWYRRSILISSFDKVILTDPFDKRGGSFTGPSLELKPVIVVAVIDRLLEYGNARTAGNLAEQWRNTSPDDVSQFTATNWPYFMNDLVDEFMKYADSLPHHFLMHFMHGAEILGYFHPDETNRKWWNKFYNTLVNDMHLQPETKEEITRRLSDDRDEWIKKSHPATTA